MYLNLGGGIFERNPDGYLIISPITIETMPMLHYMPRGKFLQISTVGCNFDCPGCISTVIVKEMGRGPTWLQRKKPDEIVQKAMNEGCLGICFLMNDPLASWPTFISVANKAKEKGLFVGCSSNAFFTEDSLRQAISCLDFINVGLKGFSEESYQRCGAASSKPVWRNIERLFRAGVHVEISCTYRKDGKEELFDIAHSIAAISEDIPLQIMRFIPMEDADPALEVSIKEAEETSLMLREYLHYVYLFNSPGTDHLTTYCINCGESVLKRDFYGPMGARLKSSKTAVNGGVKCGACGKTLPVESGNKIIPTDFYREADFQGGYPFTRALEILESIVIAMGINRQDIIVHVWNEYADRKVLHKLHQDVQNPDAFIDLVRSIGRSTGCLEKASRLAGYLESKLNFIRDKTALLENKQRVYYAMGKPLFCIKGERMENRLVEIAGGISMNKRLEIAGRPGETISVDQLNELNPEVMFISAFISSTVEDFYEDCINLGISVEAVKNKRIYAHSAPGWDFGSPRWILGLMNIAVLLHPEHFDFDLQSSADEFYETFYNIPFTPDDINRSFSKPSSKLRLLMDKQ
jgi:pyruvate-formate lyase-activating enzyme